MTIHNVDFQRQAELEIEMAGLGAARFRSRATKDMQQDRGSGTQPGSFLVGRAVDPLATAIQAFINDVYGGRPGPRAVAARLIKEMDLDVIAYLSSRAILNGLMWKGKSSLLGLAKVVAQSIEAEARFDHFSKAAPGLYAKIDGKLTKDGSTERHKQVVLTYAMGKFDIPWDVWSQDHKLHLGIKMVELFCEATGLAAMELEQVTFSGKYKAQHFVYLTEATTEWIEQSLSRGEERTADFMPTVVPPKDWTSLVGGGYYTNATRPLELVRKCHPEQRKLLQRAHLGAVYSGLNAMQRTAWRINPGILRVMEAIVVAKSDIGGLIPGRDLDLPDRPDDIDTNPDALREWKWKARDVHTANIQLRRDRLQQAQLLSLADRFRDEPAIYFPHTLDFRGRAYPVPQILHPQGSDNVKALLMFAEGKPLGADGERWLAIHGANTYGVDKVSFDKRLAWVKENQHHIWASAMDPIGYLWWTEADKPWCFLAFCFEWQDYCLNPEAFVSHIPIALDGSCNGLQHFSAMLRDPVGGAAVNLLPAENPQDIYQVVADEVIAALRSIRPSDGMIPEELEEEDGKKKKKGPTRAQIERWSHEWSHFGIDRKITKRPVMVLPYGGTPRSCVKYVEAEVLSRIDKGQSHNLGDELKPAIGFLSGVVWQSIGDVVIAAKDAMGWLQKAARTVAKENLPIHWTTPSGFVAFQAYTDMKVRQIETKIGGTIVKPAVFEATDKINRSKQATSISPNFVHSLDAASMILTVDQLAAEGVSSFAMIHDSYGTHACDTSALAARLREVFIRMYETDPLTSFRDELVATTGLDPDEDLEPLPKKGSLNLWAIQDSDFFFA
ncbi:DNA-directed RNA polymerase [Sinorhizobium fredii]|uniref:DNA-directed RNA polymerase n=1 Tax=Rhizobium fredii TaxID=380 RepID=UPI0035141527